MGLFDKKGIPVTSGFDLHADIPVDSRTVCETIEERDRLVTEHAAHEGITVYVKEKKQKYTYDGKQWKADGGDVSADLEEIKSKLDTVAEGATKVAFDNVPGQIKINDDVFQVVELSSDINEDENKAATPKSVKSAMDEALRASEAASAAQEAAAAADTKAGKAESAASDAQSTATAAQSAAEAAQSTATAAQATANEAKSAVEELEGLAAGIVGDIAEAKQTADTALTKAGEAATAAGKAQETADAAKAAAESAQITADSKATVLFEATLPETAPVGAICFLTA